MKIKLTCNECGHDLNVVESTETQITVDPCAVCLSWADETNNERIRELQEVINELRGYE